MLRNYCMRSACLFACLFTISSSALHADEGHQDWRKTLDATAARIRPTADERRWSEIPWVRTAAEAAEQAKAEDRPIFIFSVSGHDPLGRC